MSLFRIPIRDRLVAGLLLSGIGCGGSEVLQPVGQDASRTDGVQAIQSDGPPALERLTMQGQRSGPDRCKIKVRMEEASNGDPVVQTIKHTNAATCEFQVAKHEWNAYKDWYSLNRPNGTFVAEIIAGRQRLIERRRAATVTPPPGMALAGQQNSQRNLTNYSGGCSGNSGGDGGISYYTEDPINLQVGTGYLDVLFTYDYNSCVKGVTSWLRTNAPNISPFTDWSIQSHSHPDPTSYFSWGLVIARGTSVYLNTTFGPGNGWYPDLCWFTEGNTHIEHEPEHSIDKWGIDYADLGLEVYGACANLLETHTSSY